MSEEFVVGIVVLVLVVLAVVGGVAIIDRTIPGVVDYCRDYAFEYGYEYKWVERNERHTDLFCVRGAVFGEPEVMPLEEVREKCNSNGECDG